MLVYLYCWTSRLALHPIHLGLSPMHRAFHQIVTRGLFPQFFSYWKTEASNWVDWKVFRFSLDPLDSLLGDVGHVCTRTLILVTIHWSLRPDGVCFLFFFSMAHTYLFLFFICERINYFYMFSAFWNRVLIIHFQLFWCEHMNSYWKCR